MDASGTDLLLIMRTLAEHGVDYIIVGGVGAVLQGAPIATFDLDLVHARTPENIGRLLAALAVLDADYRGRGPQKIRPTGSLLASTGHHLLMTRAGPLDLLGTIGGGHDYDSLLAHTNVLDLGEHLYVRVLNLETLIRTKEEAGRDTDRAVLPILRRTLEERSKPQ